MSQLWMSVYLSTKIKCISELHTTIKLPFDTIILYKLILPSKRPHEYIPEFSIIGNLITSYYVSVGQLRGSNVMLWVYTRVRISKN